VGTNFFFYNLLGISQKCSTFKKDDVDGPGPDGHPTLQPMGMGQADVGQPF
jgi:hypothetical protein